MILFTVCLFELCICVSMAGRESVLRISVYVWLCVFVSESLSLSVYLRLVCEVLISM